MRVGVDQVRQHENNNLIQFELISQLYNYPFEFIICFFNFLDY